MIEVIGQGAKQSFDLVLAATEIVTWQPFDYFDSPKHAKAHAEAEGIDQAGLANVGAGYTRVPRMYPDDLEVRMDSAFHALGSGEDQLFVHSDRYGLTFGITKPKAGHKGDLSLVMNRRSCDLRIPMAITSFDAMVPDLHITGEDDQDSPGDRRGPVELRLGRSILVGLGKDDSEEIAKAARDTFRPWEAVLAVGEEAIGAYAAAVQAYAEEHKVIPANLPEGTMSRPKSLRICADVLKG